jgi:hypothetical protein
MNLLGDVSQLLHGIRLLQSTTLRTLSNAMLNTVLEKQTLRAAQPCDVVDYLNGRMEGDFANDSIDVTNVWARLRSATRRIQTKMDVKWTLDASQQPGKCLHFDLSQKAEKHTVETSSVDKAPFGKSSEVPIAYKMVWRSQGTCKFIDFTRVWLVQ